MNYDRSNDQQSIPYKIKKFFIGVKFLIILIIFAFSLVPFLFLNFMYLKINLSQIVARVSVQIAFPNKILNYILQFIYIIHIFKSMVILFIFHFYAHEKSEKSLILFYNVYSKE